MKFGNFTKKSFFNLVVSEIRSMHKNFPGVSNVKLGHAHGIFSITFYTNVCAIEIDNSKIEKYDRIENISAVESATDFRYYSEGYFGKILLKLYEVISIDYLPLEFNQRFKRLSTFLNMPIVRTFLRLFIIPLRRLIYWNIQILNSIIVRNMFRKFHSS